MKILAIQLLCTMKSESVGQKRVVDSLWGIAMCSVRTLSCCYKNITCSRMYYQIFFWSQIALNWMISSCLPAPGLTYKKLSRLEESLDCFLKLHAILRNSAQVMYQLASLYPDNMLCHVFICSRMFASVCRYSLNEFNHVSPVAPWLRWLGSRYELLEDPQQAIEWLMQVISVAPTDPQALAKLGELYDSEGDKSQAFQYYYEVKGNRVRMLGVF